MQETWVQSLSLKEPLEKGMGPHSRFLPGKSHGQRSLVGYSPWGHKESDATEPACNSLVGLHPHDLPKAPPSKTNTWGVRTSTYKFGEKRNIQSKEPLYCQNFEQTPFLVRILQGTDLMGEGVRDAKQGSLNSSNTDWAKLTFLTPTVGEWLWRSRLSSQPSYKAKAKTNSSLWVVSGCPKDLKGFASIPQFGYSIQA